MAQVVEASPKSEVTPVITKAKSGSNKTIIIVIAVVVALMLCVCTIVIGALFVIPNLNPEKGVTIVPTDKPVVSLNKDFEILMQEYIQDHKDIKANYDGQDEECSKSVEFDDIMKSEYYEAEIAPLYARLTQVLNAERACYKDKEEYEQDIDIKFYNKIKNFDCTRVSEADDCEEFISNFAELVQINDEYITLRDLAATERLELNTCYLRSLDDNFGNKEAQLADDDICEANNIDYSDDIDISLNRYNELLDNLDAIAENLVN